MRLSLLSFVIVLLALCPSCGGHDHTGYASFQACFDEHVGAEALPFNQAVVICCLDHPVDGVSEVCGDSAASCVTYVTANLTSTATQGEIQTACTEYEQQKSM
jgi:hypothetical protein